MHHHKKQQPITIPDGDDDDDWSPALRRGLEQQAKQTRQKNKKKKKKKQHPRLLDRDDVVFLLDEPRNEADCFDWVGAVYDSTEKTERCSLQWFAAGQRVMKLAPPYGPHNVLLNRSFRVVSRLISLEGEPRQMILRAEQQIEQFAHLQVAVSEVYFSDWIPVVDSEEEEEGE